MQATTETGRQAGEPRAAPQNPAPAYRLPVEEVLVRLQADARHGLSAGEANARLREYGPNELAEEKPVPQWRKFLAQFQNVLVLLLLVATAISAGLWLYERESALPYEAMAIFAVVLLNAAMGYIQESRAEEAVAALRQMSAARANVVREGIRRSLPAAELVPGDIIITEQGDTIPADARLIHCAAFQAAEAALTGESLPVSKNTLPIMEDSELADRHNMVFSGTAVTSGQARAVVVATGMQTELGHIAGMLEQAPAEITPLQRELARMGRLLGIMVVAIALVMIATIILVEEVRGFAAILDVLILGVALAVAAIPEGLPAIVTAVLSLGVQRMARRNAIVRHLPAVETLGSATVIASDKTGTLTKNEMTVRTIVIASGRIDISGEGYAPKGIVRRHRDGNGSDATGDEKAGDIDGALRMELERALTVAACANNAVLQEQDDQWTIQGDPTEGALIVAARKAGLDNDTLGARFERVGEVPFSSERKLHTTLHADAQKDGCLIVFTKGAPDLLLERCTRELAGDRPIPLTEGRRAEILDSNEQLAGEALRSLGVAFRRLPAEIPGSAPVAMEIDGRIEHGLVFIGLIGMLDPPRAEAKEAVARARAAGIRPIMITGDHPATASAIAEALGIAGNGRVLGGSEIEKMPDEALDRSVREVSVYARVNPEHKLRIVQALQRGGAVVAMTGDGVNDAPALKTADIGIAMGVTGTDVSRQAADMILADDNFATIVAAVEEGRSIFSNIRKFLRYLLSSNMSEVLAMFFGVLLADLVGLKGEEKTVVLPLLATQLLWINLVTDGAPALALGMDPPDADAMRKPPRPTGEGVITPRMWLNIVYLGLIMAVGTLLVLDASLPGGFIEGSGDIRYAQTMTFNTLVLLSLFNIFNARSEDQSAFTGLFSNKWLWGAVALSLLLQLAVLYTPFLQQAFSTVSLSLEDWVFCTVVGSSVLWLSELRKLIARVLISRDRTESGHRNREIV